MLFGCGKSNENNEAKEEKEVVLKVAHVEPETRSTNRALLIFKEEVEEASKGKYKNRNISKMGLLEEMFN